MGETGSGSLKELEREARGLRAREDWSEKAIEANTRILEVDPRNVAALNRRAKCYREQKDLAAAGVDYRRALELDPGNTKVREVLREIEEEARKQRSDRELVEKVHSIEDFDEAHAIARAHKNKPLPKRRIAVEAFRRAFLLDRRRTDVLIELAAVHRGLRQRDDAEKIYEWILKRETDSSAAKVGLASIYKDKKRLRDGLKLCDEVLAHEWHNSYALRCRAGILSELDRGAEAVKTYQKSLGPSR